MTDLGVLDVWDGSQWRRVHGIPGPQGGRGLPGPQGPPAFGSQVLFRQLTPVEAASATIEWNLVNWSNVPQIEIGDLYQFKAWGSIITNTSGTFNLRARLGTFLPIETTPFTLNSTNSRPKPWVAEFEMLRTGETTYEAVSRVTYGAGTQSAATHAPVVSASYSTTEGTIVLGEGRRSGLATLPGSFQFSTQMNVASAAFITRLEGARLIHVPNKRDYDNTSGLVVVDSAVPVLRPPAPVVLWPQNSANAVDGDLRLV